jgi:hypothetical protein
MELALETATAALITAWVDMVVLLDAETENDVVLTTLALTAAVLEVETENAPLQTR